MALVRRQRFILTNHTTRAASYGSLRVSLSWQGACVLQDIDGAVCWRCKREYRRGDNLVHVERDSCDVVNPEKIYHYRCIPPARWHKLAGSLPAWDLPSDESPAEKSGTSSAVDPTIQ